jgi:hypothetical protein
MRDGIDYIASASATFTALPNLRPMEGWEHRKYGKSEE